MVKPFSAWYSFFDFIASKNSLYGCLFLMFSGLSGLLSGQSRLSSECTNVKIGGGGFVSSIIAHPSVSNVFYARTDVGGAYRWNEVSKTWEAMMDWVTQDQEALFGVESIAIDPANPQRVYLTAGYSGYGWPGQSFLVSEDAGHTWDIRPMSIYIHGNGMGRQSGEKLQVDPFDSNVLWLGSRKNGVLKSSDRGKTWGELAGFPVKTTANLNGVSFLLPDATSGATGGHAKTLYAGVSKSGENIYRSTDGGISWQALPNAPQGQNIMPQRAILTEGGKKLVVTYANGAGPHPQNWDGVDDRMNRGGVFVFDTETENWKDISPVDFLNNPVSGGCYGGISFAHGKLYVSSINHYGNLQYFTDGSSAWGDRLYVSDDLGQKWKSFLDGRNYAELDNNGVGWISGHNLHWVGCFLVDPFNEDRIFATSGNGIFMTENATGAKPIFSFHPHGVEETVPLDLASVQDGPSLVSIIGDYDGFVHHDINQYPTERHQPTMGTSTGIAIAPNQNKVWARCGSSAAVIYYTLNGGQSWLPIQKLPMAATNGKIAIQSQQGKNLICWIPEGQSDKIFITGNEGASWTNVWESSIGNINGAKPVADPFDPAKFIVFNKQKGKLYGILYTGNSRPEVKLLAETGSSPSADVAVSLKTPGKMLVCNQSEGLKLVQNSQVLDYAEIRAEAVCIGPGSSEAEPEAVYVWGTHRGLRGMYRSTDEGQTWFLINDENHMFGGLSNGRTIVADQNYFGRVFMTTAARGVASITVMQDTLYLDPLDATSSTFNDIIPVEHLVVTPNPAHDLIQISGAEKMDLVLIYNESGCLVKKSDRLTDNMTIEISSLPPGAYFVRGQNRSGFTLGTFFIKN